MVLYICISCTTIFEQIGGKWSVLRAYYRLSNVMDANVDGEEIVLDSDTDDPEQRITRWSC